VIVSLSTCGLEWAVASRPVAGEVVSGDVAVVEPREEVMLFAVVDALGHGPGAAETAEAAARALRSYCGSDVAGALEHCHARLARTRGAAVTVLALPTGAASLTCAGAGNIAVRLVHGSGPPPRRMDSAVPSFGVVGDRVGPIRSRELPLARGDVVLVATDGVDAAFAEWLDLSGSPQQIAERVIANHARDEDDALVLVARVLRGPV
jgi:negative regulator of sigma-B (phosphoserine phosphatase)